jgi:hypothetical protein
MRWKNSGKSILIIAMLIGSFTTKGALGQVIKEELTVPFGADEFGLYKHLYGKETGTISPEQSKEMKKKYVGREFNIMAYETGGFTGVPAGYFKYQPIRQDRGFFSGTILP